MTTISSTQASTAATTSGGKRRAGGVRPGRIAAHTFMIIMAFAWVLPLLFALYISFRPISSTAKYGYVSLPIGGLTFANYVNAWTQGEIGHYLINSAIITIPAVLITLLFASAVGFVISQVKMRGRLVLLIIFTAGNLLPQQALITPLYRIFLSIPLPNWLSSSGLMYDSLFGLIVINVTFQLGFCVFVLSNYMTTIPGELYEAALVDGASLWRRFWNVTLPICRPALAALGTLLTIWIYNDFFWATVLMSTGSKRPITSALNNLQGQFVSNQNVIAAAALIAAVPTLIVYLVLQRQFVAGLALGATKG
ncbi:carbohydrate ABC transporter permease [Humibacter ginsenosidimutans]|uniref:Carbohydrate ABC transporter permease n=1 Tax=Humibacter ginsenosidimutans TaxID=2599293 RepID=A0A5B8M1G1_9MICO|nr:carbohydrate ABC transporter permease [Humibacter ginsenosidimutans]QDZ14517.1 carbohydrate ABC transporter permease [Humibacter ginsenosidimutans]